jgi:hypothetical protein
MRIKIFCIKIMDRKALLVLYTLSRNVTFSMLKEPITRLSVRIYRSRIMLLVLTYFANLGKLG